MLKSKVNRFISLLLSFIMISAMILINPIELKATALPGLSDIGRMAAAEGIVLLENPIYKTVGEDEKRVLPLKDRANVSIFGAVQDYYYQTGTGSGGKTRTEHVTTIPEGLKNNPNVIVNDELASVYKEWIRQNPYVENGGWQDTPEKTTWGQKEMPLENSVVESASKKSDAAVVIIGRTGGEDHEVKNIKGSFLLTDTEVDMLNKVYAAFDRVVVVLNVGYIIDMRWAANYPNAAIVYGWQGGMEGGSATADVLTGDITPSGKLTDTIAEKIEDYPAYENHWVEKWNSIDYEEDIYVGYRYFETFAKEKVLYPFGYGLSYTNFEIKTDDVKITNENIALKVTVKNIGDVKGKEVVQIYYSAPQGVLGKPAKELAAFGKTGTLQPGESQTMDISFKTNEMASYDDGGVTALENKSCFVLEAGDYKLFVGNSVRNCNELAQKYIVANTKVTERLGEAMAPTQPLEIMKPGSLQPNGNYERTYVQAPQRTIDLQKEINDNLPKAVPTVNNKAYKLVDVYKGNITLDQFIAQFTPQDLAAISIGEEGTIYSVPMGTAGVIGGVTKSLRDMGIPVVSCADGPAGIRVGLASGYMTGIPIGTMLACTWNVDLVQRLNEYWGEEMLLNNIDTILGPGADIHRHPLCGRNFEYYSEDPVITGMMASAATRGIQSKGPIPTFKHIAANNLEYNRGEVNSRVSERALREIYLKGYEIAIKSSDLHSIMTSYNAINGTFSSSNYEMCTTILRDQWGYDGILMTDWWSGLGEDQAFYTRAKSDKNGKAMIRAQQDVWMRKNDGDVERNLGNMNTVTEYEKGNLTLGEMQRTAKNICEFLMRTQTFAKQENMPYVVNYTPKEDYFKVSKGTSYGDPLITGITIDSKRIRADLFNPLKLEYKAFYDGSGNYPIVSATGNADTTISIKQATSELPTAFITASSNNEERIYKIIFTEEEGVEPLFENPTYAYLSDIKIDGTSLKEYQETMFNYSIGVVNPYEMPTVTVTEKEGVTAYITKDIEKKQIIIRAVSADQANIYRIQIGKLPVSDEFNEPTLNPAWKINTESPNNGETNQWNLTENPGHLRIYAEKGSFWRGQNHLKNFFQQEVFGNWEATAKIDMNRHPSYDYETTGLVASQDNDNYIYLKYEGSSRVIALMKEVESGDPVRIGAMTGLELSNLIGNQTTIYFRMKKIGNTYSGYVSADGEKFICLGSTASNFENPKFGFMTAFGDSDPKQDRFITDYDYIRFNSDPERSALDMKVPNTVIKVAETEASAMTSKLLPENTDDKGGGRHFTQCYAGESATYDMVVKEAGEYKLSARYKATNSNPLAQMSFSIYDGDNQIGGSSFVTTTNGKWKTDRYNGYSYLSAGIHKIKIVFDDPGFNLNWIKFQLKQEPVNTNALATLIEQAENIDQDSYPSAKRAAFEDNLQEAKIVAAEPVNQLSVDEAVKLLSDAIDNFINALPINKLPRGFDTIENGIRIWPINSVWIYTENTTSGRPFVEGGSGNLGYAQVKDTLYLGKIDLTGLKEIRIEYGQGNKTKIGLGVYSEAAVTGTPTFKHSTSFGSQSTDIYIGGSMEMKKPLAKITFNHDGNNWGVYGSVSTAGVSSSNPQFGSYVTNETFLNTSEATGEQNVYIRMDQDIVNLKYVDFIYEPKDETFDINLRADGNKITDLQEAAGKTLVAESKFNGKIDPYLLIAALYDGTGKMISCESVQSNQNEPVTSVAINIPKDVSDISYKLFVWDSASYLPLMDAISLD